MPSLLDHIDRFSFTTQSISSTSRQTARTPKGPFVRAALETPLWNLARDIDASELGLFTLVSNANATVGQKEEKEGAMMQKTELTRAEFHGATPLRKPAVGRRAEEKDPEVYAEAALKYLDKYQSIRSMSEMRTEVVELLEHLATLREEVNTLSASSAEETRQGGDQVITIKGEEKRIQELTSRVKQLKTRKDLLLKKRRPLGPGSPPMSSADTSQDAFWGEPVPRSKSKARQSLLPPSGDDSFLLDSHMDMNFGDVSMDSLADIPPTPLPSRLQTVSMFTKPKPAEPVSQPVSSPPNDKGGGIIHSPAPDEDANGTEDQPPDEEDEKTIVLQKAPPVTPPPPRPSSVVENTPSPTPQESLPLPPPSQDVRSPRPVTPMRPQSASDVATPATERKSKLRITSDTERIVAKIWTTMADIIMPGHPFNVATAATSNKPPRAKETIALLQTIASQSPSPGSPSTHSTLSSLAETSGPGAAQPTAPQILTALLLFTLLSDPPTYAMPLAKAKEVLASRGLGAAVAAGPLGALSVGGQALETRALYGCIAKRLLKIDRSGKEQILKFDI
ncbi:hypothetical protein SCHPADRAFT_992788 [Schizopora paradoxa]|uniref:Uncharacterized protein n=1 Tax=Schizopora paradoxa TaxID=27342 RepID=A0A0H2S5M1_9AGAM|nr:hypothetical protein SCHPADRAFT_992788 [Schizopora paradoxa]